jgi:hypothetical protein
VELEIKVCEMCGRLFTRLTNPEPPAPKPRDCPTCLACPPIVDEIHIVMYKSYRIAAGVKL